MNRFVKIALQVASTAIPGAAQVQILAKSIPGLKGQAKQDAVLDLVKASLLTAESVADRDLLNDPEVEKATRAMIDAVVAFQKVLVKKAPAA